jgi:hypothetical protein
MINGERLATFCAENGLIVTGTCFPHKGICVSPYGMTVNQIGQVLINKTWRRSIKNTKVYRGADAPSDHYLVISKMNKDKQRSHQKRLQSQIRHPKTEEQEN